jgi:hypothetical protein
MVEIWVPYGPVEVSFDIWQENLAQILEPQVKKLSREEIDAKTIEFSEFDSILVLTQTSGTGLILDSILSQQQKLNSADNKRVSKLIHTKETRSLVRRKAQEYQISSVEELNTEDLSDIGTVDASQAKIFSSVKNSSNLALLTSVHYDPMFGLTSAASDLLSISKEGMNEAFKRSYDELPSSPRKSNASWYATRVLQTCPNVNAIEIVEKSSSPIGVPGIFSGEPEATHARMLDFWSKNLSSQIPSRSERVIFGCGGEQNDRTLSESLRRSFFNIIENAALKDSNAKICMLAECSQGLGSEALLRYVTGRFTPGAKLDNLTYFDGLEVLLSFYKIQDELELSMISTLPKYYGEKFQFKMFSGAREAPQAVVSPGSRAKITVIPDGSNIAVSMKQEQEDPKTDVGSI